MVSNDNKLGIQTQVQTTFMFDCLLKNNFNN